MKKGKKGKGHQAQHQMAGHHDGHSGHDALAHPTHKQANRAHDMPEGLAPDSGYDGCDAGEGSHLGENQDEY